MATHYLTRHFVVPIRIGMEQAALFPLSESLNLGTVVPSNSSVGELSDSVTLGDRFPYIVPLQDNIITKDDDKAFGRDNETLYISDPRYFKKNVGGQ